MYACIYIYIYKLNSYVNVRIYACPCACITGELKNPKLAMYIDDGMVLCNMGLFEGNARVLCSNHVLLCEFH